MSYPIYSFMIKIYEPSVFNENALIYLRIETVMKRWFMDWQGGIFIAWKKSELLVFDLT